VPNPVTKHADFSHADMVLALWLIWPWRNSLRSSHIKVRPETVEDIPAIRRVEEVALDGPARRIWWIDARSTTWMRWPFAARGADVVLTFEHNYERLIVDGIHTL